MDIPKEKRSHWVMDSVAISALVLLGKALGFVKEMVIASFFGANVGTDTFFAAENFISNLSLIIGSAASSVIITHYIKLNCQESAERTKNLMRESFLAFTVLALILVCVCALLSPWIARMIGLSYNAAQQNDLIRFLVLMSPIILLNVLSGVAGGYLDANKRFLPGRTRSLFISVSIIAFLFLFHERFGLYSLSIAYVVASLLHSAFVLSLTLPYVGVQLLNPFRDPEFRHMLKRYFPLLAGISVTNFGHIIDKIIASALEEGNVSFLHYGQAISGDVISTLFVTSIGSVLLTSLTENVASQRGEVVLEQVRYVLCAMLAITLPLSALYLIEGQDLIRLAFEHGNFNMEHTRTVAVVASCYALGFPFLAIRDALTRAHYAYRDTFRPMINSIIGVCVNILGSVYLSRFFGVSGIAVATSFSLLVISIISLVTLKRHMGQLLLNRKLLFDCLKILSGTCCSFLGGYWLYVRMAEQGYVLRMCVVSIIMLCIYGIILFLTRERIEAYIVQWAIARWKSKTDNNGKHQFPSF